MKLTHEKRKEVEMWVARNGAIIDQQLPNIESKVAFADYLTQQISDMNDIDVRAQLKLLYCYLCRDILETDNL